MRILILILMLVLLMLMLVQARMVRSVSPIDRALLKTPTSLCDGGSASQTIGSLCDRGLASKVLPTHWPPGHSKTAARDCQLHLWALPRQAGNSLALALAPGPLWPVMPSNHGHWAQARARTALATSSCTRLAYPNRATSAGSGPPYTGLPTHDRGLVHPSPHPGRPNLLHCSCTVNTQHRVASSISSVID